MNDPLSLDDLRQMGKTFVPLSTRIKLSTKIRLQKYCDRTGDSMTQTVDQALDRFLSDKEGASDK